MDFLTSLSGRCGALREIVERHRTAPELHIGSDSLPRPAAEHRRFATVLCVRNPGCRGAVVYYRTTRRPARTLAERLFTEAMLSLELAIAICAIAPEMGERIVVHLDANPDARFRSSNHAQELAAMIAGNGFRHRLKPDAWAAHAADFVVRGAAGRGAPLRPAG